MAYASISQIENDTTSIISPQETEKLLQMKGVVPIGRAASWLARVAGKFVGHRKVHVFHTFIVYVHDNFRFSIQPEFYCRCMSH